MDSRSTSSFTLAAVGATANIFKCTRTGGENQYKNNTEKRREHTHSVNLGEKDAVYIWRRESK